MSDLLKRNNVILPAPSGEALAEVREKAGMTQHELSELLKLSNKSLVSSYEREIRNPSAHVYSLMLLLTDQHPSFRLTKRR